MKVNRSSPTSVRVFQSNDIREKLKANFPVETTRGSRLYIENIEDEEETTGFSVVLETDVEVEQDSYDVESEEVTTEKRTLTRINKGFASYDGEWLYIYAKSEVAGNLVDYFDIQSNQEIEPASSVPNAREMAGNVSSVKLLFPGSQYVKKLSLQGNSLEDKNIREVADEDYEMISVTGKFELDDNIKITGRVSQESVLFYLPAEEIKVSKLNELVSNIISD